MFYRDKVHVNADLTKQELKKREEMFRQKEDVQLKRILKKRRLMAVAEPVEKGTPSGKTLFLSPLFTFLHQFLHHFYNTYF